MVVGWSPHIQHYLDASIAGSMTRGTGGDGHGRNMLGQLLMRVRETLVEAG